MDILNLIITLVSGAIGGNVGGKAVSEEKNLGPLANTIIGLVGGGAGDFLLKSLGVLAATGAATATGASTGSEFDIGSILANIGVSGVSGGVLTAVVALIKGAIQKK
jgi:uncharacterized membrane protein YeaQ/YmgE (transglycosylase-associated protein family)